MEPIFHTSIAEQHYAVSSINTLLFSAQCTLYALPYKIIQPTVCNVLCSVLTVYSIIYWLNCWLFIVQIVFLNVHRWLYNEFCSEFNIYCAIFFVCVHCSLHCIAATPQTGSKSEGKFSTVLRVRAINVRDQLFASFPLFYLDLQQHSVREVCSRQSVVCSVHCAVCNMQCAVFSVLPTVWNLQWAV